MLAPVLLLFRDGIGPLELVFCGGRCAAFGGNVRSDGRLRSFRSVRCCLLDAGAPPAAAAAAAAAADAPIADDDDACCIIFWCADDDEEEDL